MNIPVLAGLAAILGFLGAGLVMLARISLRMGQLLERLDGHIRVSDERDADKEARLRVVESRALANGAGRLRR